MMRQFNRNSQVNAETEDSAAGHIAYPVAPESQLAQWPCQIKLVPVNAPYFDGAKLLIAADCTAYAYANMHPGIHEGKDYHYRLSEA